MGAFKANEDMDHYGGQGSAGFFSLKDDKDTARVRFMYSGIEDVQGYAVHEVKIDDKRRLVNCLRDYRQPLDVCPFCREHKAQQVKLMVPLYNIDADKVQIWERGKKFMNKLSSVCSRYSSATTPLCSHIFDVERNGKKGDQATTYELYEVESDGTPLADLPEIPDPLGSIILDKSADDMDFYLENGYFPPDGDEDDEVPVRRRESREREEAPRRRTPRGRDVY